MGRTEGRGTLRLPSTTSSGFCPKPPLCVQVKVPKQTLRLCHNPSWGFYNCLVKWVNNKAECRGFGGSFPASGVQAAARHSWDQQPTGSALAWWPRVRASPASAFRTLLSLPALNVFLPFPHDWRALNFGKKKKKESFKENYQNPAFLNC